MGRAPIVPDVVEKEVTENPIELDISTKQAEDLKLIEKKAERVKKPRSEKQMEATKKLIEKNKEWREKLKAEKSAGKSDNHIQSLLAEKSDEAPKEEVKSTKIRFRIRKPTVHPRPNHHLKRKAASQAQPNDSDVGNTSAPETTDVDTDAVVDELRRRASQSQFPASLPSGKKFITMR